MAPQNRVCFSPTFPSPFYVLRFWQHFHRCNNIRCAGGIHSNPNDSCLNVSASRTRNRTPKAVNSQQTANWMLRKYNHKVLLVTLSRFRFGIEADGVQNWVSRAFGWLVESRNRNRKWCCQFQVSRFEPLWIVWHFGMRQRNAGNELSWYRFPDEHVNSNRNRGGWEVFDVFIEENVAETNNGIFSL